MGHNRTQELARWVSELRFEDIPASVLHKTKLQILNTLAAQEASKEVLSEKPLLPGNPLIQKQIEAIALDFDDYLFLGHPSHSAVLPALHLSPELEVSGKEILTAIVCGNEAAGRLGAACFLGPLNGQMWSFIHLLGAACSVGKLRGATSQEMENAIGLALSHPPFPLEEGFFGTDAKLLTAALPALHGILAARWAQEGAQGPKNLLEPGSEFFERFSFKPLHGVLSDWGESWVSETLSFKKYPGCVYFQSAFEALGKIKAISKEETRKILFRTNLFTYEVDRRSPENSWTPSAINFSLKNSAALFLCAQELGAAQFKKEFLSQNREDLRAWAEKIQVIHEPALTRAMLARFFRHLEAEKLLAEFSLADIFRLRTETLRRHPEARKAIGLELLRPFLKSRFKSQEFRLNDVQLSHWEMSFPIRLEIQKTSGHTEILESEVPAGSCSDPRQESIVRRKFLDAFRRLPTEQAQNQLERWMTLESAAKPSRTPAAPHAQPSRN